MNATNNKNSATLLHLSSLTQYCIPLGNFIFPIIIWSSLREKSTYVDQQGKECINFQLSLFMYAMVMALIAVPTFLVGIMKGLTVRNITCHGDFILDHFDASNMTWVAAIFIIVALLFVMMAVAQFLLTIYAAVKTSRGENFKYPLTVRFLK